MIVQTKSKVLGETDLHRLALGRPWSPMLHLGVDGIPERLERIMERVWQGTAADQASALREFEAAAGESGDPVLLGQASRLAFELGEVEAVYRFAALLDRFPTYGMLHVVDAANLIDDAQRAGLSGGTRRPAREMLRYAPQRAVGTAMLQKMAGEHPLDAVRSLSNGLLTAYSEMDRRRVEQMNELAERQDAGESRLADVVRHAELLFGMDLEDPAIGCRFAILDRLGIELARSADDRRLLELAVVCHARLGLDGSDDSAGLRAALRSVAPDSPAHRPFPTDFVAMPPAYVVSWGDAVMAAVAGGEPADASDLDLFIERAGYFPYSPRFAAGAALILAMAGNAEDARAWSKVATTHGVVWDFMAHYRLARALRLLGDQAGAREHIRAAFDGAETAQEREDARELLRWLT